MPKHKEDHYFRCHLLECKMNPITCCRCPSLRLDIHSNSLQFLLTSLFLLLCVIDPVVSPTLSLFPFLCPSPLSLHTIFPIIMFTMYAFSLCCTHTSMHAFVWLFCHWKEGGRELFVGKIMGIYHPLFRKLQALARARQRWEKITRRYYSPFKCALPLVRVKRQKEKLNQLKKSFSFGFFIFSRTKKK